MRASLRLAGTLANPNKCAGNRALWGMHPFSAPRPSGCGLTQCFPPTVTSKKLFTICEPYGHPQKFFSKIPIDASLILPYSTI